MLLRLCHSYFAIFFFKQKTAYEMRISDWSSDVCSSDLLRDQFVADGGVGAVLPAEFGLKPAIAGRSVHVAQRRQKALAQCLAYHRCPTVLSIRMPARSVARRGAAMTDV